LILSNSCLLVEMLSPNFENAFILCSVVIDLLSKLYEIMILFDLKFKCFIYFLYFPVHFKNAKCNIEIN
jgi:hypothetical protein